jgi:serine/threonine protein kinase
LDIALCIVAQREPMIGKQVGPYRILEKIGQGGMGVVYKAVHTQLEQEVAIKVPAPEYAQDPSMRERFIAEAKLQAKLSHPHVVNVFNYLQDESNVFLVMEYIKGPTLEQRLATIGRIPPQEALLICQDVLAALCFMHSRGVIHRDIKPGNIMFTDTGVVKVTDFGIAKVAGEKGRTKTAMQIGTLCYMSPEQIQGKPAGVASDLYTLGVTLYQMVTGKLPFHGDSEYSIMRAHIEEAPAPPWEIQAHISPGLGRVILKAIEKKPEHRYQNAREFAEALAGLVSEPCPVESGVPRSFHGRSAESPASRLKNWQHLALIASLGIALVVILSFGFFQSWGIVRLRLFTPPRPSITENPTATADVEPSHSPDPPAPSFDRRAPTVGPQAAVERGIKDEPRDAESSSAGEGRPPEAAILLPRGEGVSIRDREGNAAEGEPAQAPPVPDPTNDTQEAISEPPEQRLERDQGGEKAPSQGVKRLGRMHPRVQPPKGPPGREVSDSSSGWYIRK